MQSRKILSVCLFSSLAMLSLTGCPHHHHDNYPPPPPSHGDDHGHPPPPNDH